MYCRFCGTPLVFQNQRYCSVCGSLVAEPKQKSKIGQFFLSLLKGAGYYAIFYAIVLLIQSLYTAGVAGSVAAHGNILDSSGYLGYSDAYWDMYSKGICWLMILIYVVVILTYNLIFLLRKKKPLQEVGVRKMQIAAAPSAFVFGVALQIAVVFVIAILSSMIPGVAEDSAAGEEMFNHMYGSSSLVSRYLFTAVATPVMEEVLFRGLIYTRMKKGMPMIAAMILSSLVFGFAHSGFVQIIYASALGFVMAFMYEKYNSLWISIFLHAGFNSANFIYDCLNMNSLLVQWSLMALSAGLVLVFIAYFFVTKPVYETTDDLKDDKSAESQNVCEKTV